MTEPVRVGQLIRERKINVCCGAGGVGKTTTAAAISIAAARAGRKVLVLTIDPSKRLAETLGVFNWSTILKPLGGVLPDWIVIPPDLSIVPTEYKLTVSFVILVITLLWRPTGIFKGQST